MKIKFNRNLLRLASVIREKYGVSLYVVGGTVRNFLLTGEPLGSDVDLSAPLLGEEFISAAKECGFTDFAEYKNTGTVKCSCENVPYEFTCFRRDTYKRGGSHIPEKAIFTTDIIKDAKRRDFKCNAIYYDVANEKIADPLHGVNDVKNKKLSATDFPVKVFSHDGLRLMRLARFCGELGFTASFRTFFAARLFSKNITDISPERVYDELKKILVADEKYGFSPKEGAYIGLKMLDKTRVLDKIIPELALGRGMKQRKDFHKYDVLEHSIKCVLYAPKEIRLAALLHDAGKPYCKKTTGKYAKHDYIGAKIVENILKRLKASNKEIEQVTFLTRYHMYDIDCRTKESKVCRFIAENYQKIPQLLMLKQADYSACKDSTEIAPTVKRWKKILAKMEKNNAPIKIKDLAVTPEDLIREGFVGKEIGEALDYLLKVAVVKPKLNQKDTLISIAIKHKSK